MLFIPRFPSDWYEPSKRFCSGIMSLVESFVTLSSFCTIKYLTALYFVFTNAIIALLLYLMLHTFIFYYEILYKIHFLDYLHTCIMYSYRL